MQGPNAARVQDRSCDQLLAVAADGGAAGSAVVQLLGPTVLAEIRGPDL